MCVETRLGAGGGDGEMTETKVRTVVARTTSGPQVDSDYPSLTEKALGQLKLAWRLAHEVDDWTKGGRISDGFDRWTGWPYMAKLSKAHRATERSPFNRNVKGRAGYVNETIGLSL